MYDKDNWSGTIAEIYNELCGLVAMSREDRTFPKHSNKSRRHLERIKDSLRDYGVTFSIADFHTQKGVPITIMKLLPKYKPESIGNLSSASSVSSEPNKINGLRAEDSLKIPVDTRQVSSAHNSLKNKENEHPEDSEDKIPALEGEL